MTTALAPSPRELTRPPTDPHRRPPRATAGQKLVVNEVLSRRKLKNSYEYEVSWVGQPVDKNSWLPRRQLEEMGFGKLVDAVDSREAAAAGLHSKPLTAANIAKHLEGLGLEPEFSLHSRMKGLSGGQKVKVVLGAATCVRLGC